MIRAIIKGTGCCIPEIKISNSFFSANSFFEKDHTPVAKDNSIVIEKFKEVTGIEERRYARSDQKASDLAFIAATEALKSSGLDPESLDHIIVAHNFGDVAAGSNHVDMLPSLASRVKLLLKIKNPNCVAYDIPFGCPGWVEGVIHANYFIRSGDAKRCMVIGAETISRVIDPHDRDSMIYSDGAGAIILEATNSEAGIISHKTQTYALDHAMLLTMGHSYSTDPDLKDNLYVKMNGRRVYEFALTQVPLLIKEMLDKAAVDISTVKKILIHQANGKMDAAIVQRLFKLYGSEVSLDEVMPMTISWLGNSSVATIPTLLDLILKGKFPDHAIHPGDKVVFASVGAGMNINAILYQF
jgi:3-oxoacyl-[acyl-carrier-protein] synthase III